MDTTATTRIAAGDRLTIDGRLVVVDEAQVDNTLGLVAVTWFDPATIVEDRDGNVVFIESGVTLFDIPRTPCP